MPLKNAVPLQQLYCSAALALSCHQLFLSILPPPPDPASAEAHTSLSWSDPKPCWLLTIDRCSVWRGARGVWVPGHLHQGLGCRVWRLQARPYGPSGDNGLNNELIVTNVDSLTCPELDLWDGVARQHLGVGQRRLYGQDLGYPHRPVPSDAVRYNFAFSQTWRCFMSLFSNIMVIMDL